MKTPRERWGTCCPNDPECEHSFMDDNELTRWMDTPISDSEAMPFEDAAIYARTRRAGWQSK